ncbi:MAG: hypothetical protein EA412_12555 [Chitinophagaceae bacterium]|nr:MAG: hypothetical protein EA412_12555 [Chitinophagaceae bacterium]
MKVFNIGDNVRHIQDNYIGVITAIHRKNIFEITKSDGSIQLAKKKDLVLFNQTSSIQNKPLAKELIYLGCVIENEGTPLNKEIRFYLINDTSFSFNVKITFRDRDSELFKHPLISVAKSSVLLYSCPFSFLNNNLKYISNISLSNDINEKGIETEKLLKVKHFEKLKTTLPLMDDENGILFELYSTHKKSKEKLAIDMHIVEELKKSLPNKKKNSILLEKEIDIHFDKIPDNLNIPKNERLIFQINYLEKEIDNAIKEGLWRLVVIHGHGKGTLKNEVLKLKEKYSEIVSIKTLHSKRYAGGASEINFK